MRFWQEGVQPRHWKGGAGSKRPFSPSEKSFMCSLVTAATSAQPVQAKPWKLPSNAHGHKEVKPVVQAYSTIYIDLPQELLAVLETDVKERLNTKVNGLSFVTGNSAASTRDHWPRRS